MRFFSSGKLRVRLGVARSLRALPGRGSSLGSRVGGAGVWTITSLVRSGSRRRRVVRLSRTSGHPDREGSKPSVGTLNRAQTVERIRSDRISAIIRAGDEGVARDAMAAAVEGGFRLVEFTLTTPGAMTLISEFAARDGLLVGAGTVLSEDQARSAVDAGASFLVSPIVDRSIIELAGELGAAVIPGAYSPTEMETAHRYGADFIKVFPAPAGGVDFIRAVRGPLPHLPLFPTNGVTADNLGEYLSAGVVGAGFVKPLFDPQLLADQDFAGICERAARIVGELRSWSEKSAN